METPFLKACANQIPERTPVWVMRQAGRYLPEYRELRAKAGSFLNLCHNPEMAAEATLQPIRRFDLDAAILFSDILIPFMAMGMDLQYAVGEGPRLGPVIQSMDDVERLGRPDPEETMGFTFAAIRKVVDDLAGKTPLIGFGGGPWTLACYACQGKGSPTWPSARKMLYGSPEIMEALMDKITLVVGDLLVAQAKAGCSAIQLFESWAGILDPIRFRTMVLPRVESIGRRIRAEGVPFIYFVNGAAPHLEALAKTTEIDVVGVDWRMSLSQARSSLGPDKAVQGNLDPMILHAPVKAIQREVRRVLDEAGSPKGHIFNLGHGIDPSVPVDHFNALVEAVHAG